MAEDAGEKSQDPTPHRRQQAREEGQVAQSQDLGSAALLMGGLLVLMGLGGAVVDYFARLLIAQLEGDAWVSADAQFVVEQWNTVVLGLGKVLLPVLGLLVLLGAGVHLMQIGFLLLPDKLTPDLSRINPLSGLTRLFSIASFMRLTFGIFKVAVICAVAYNVLAKRQEDVLALTRLELPQIALYAWEIVLWTSLKIGLALFILAILDYGYQRWKHEKDLRMTPQEVREEMRNQQGDPQVISRRKSVQRQLAMNRMSSAVPKADVVITNPTELAIAVQYDPETMIAPIVVAKGAGVVAQRIRKLALEHGVPIVEKKPLAQALYKEVDLNHPIPDQMYAGVAEVLAYVYQLKGKKMPGRRD